VESLPVNLFSKKQTGFPVPMDSRFVGFLLIKEDLGIFMLFASQTGFN
jgi:hypothetical protein